ncbi:transglutaminase-like domain-containing protein [Actinokineospora bangkokensis]|uniref:Transglutaminase-like domain-containing protein n=1 Tax=Actinokineospora bangkokensis TaxID=1193682 RepID=A0A1Q9LLZ2_9PSEU|nr:transglutaminase family protein [Actinokineospora bangkokensis]OLR93013.1 hypothetical protein BJP25_18815 [Actinokineospora bangkokensis]
MNVLNGDTSTAPLLDHTALDLDGADRVGYRLEQSFRYDYPTPVGSVRQRLVFVPAARHGDQHLREHDVTVLGAASRRWTTSDLSGNTIVKAFAPAVADHVEFRLRAVLERVRADGPTTLPSLALTDRRLRRTTRLTAADDAIRDVAAGFRGHGLDLAEQLCAWVHSALRYANGTTTVTTTAAEALAGGVGVCQDSAHLMLALCHQVGLPARYVSGHLLGQGGTHAWVEVILPHPHGAVATPFDPCNGRRATAAYLTVATGRDYADVAPTSGSYVGAPGGTLTATRTVGVIAVS